jgi:hypothetical protein
MSDQIEGQNFKRLRKFCILFRDFLLDFWNNFPSWLGNQISSAVIHDDLPDYCQDCGCMLDWEMKGSGDDIIRPGYVTASGDVYCSRCGREYDEEEDRQAEEDYYEPPPEAYQEYVDDLLADQNEDMLHDQNQSHNGEE